MSEQKKLASPRKGITFEVKIGTQAIFLRTGEYEDGSLGEIFIDMYKEGAGYKSILANLSITVSWLLQFGVPLEKLVTKFQFTRFEPSGVVVGDPEIKMCSSILDYVFRRLGITYLNQQELGNVQVEASELPEFIEEPEELKSPNWEKLHKDKNLPNVEVYTFGSGSTGYKPVGYRAKEFLNYCRKNAEQKSTGVKTYTLQFTDDSIANFGGIAEEEFVLNIVKKLFYTYYGKSLELMMGDV